MERLRNEVGTIGAKLRIVARMNEDLESKRRIILRKYLDGLISRREAIERYIALGGKLPDFQASVDTIAAEIR